MKIHCDLSVTFAAICVILNFSAYPVCMERNCSGTLIGYIYSVLIWDSYFLTKIFLYLLFFGRLFNRHYQRTQQYSRSTKCLLLILLLLLVSAMVAFGIADGLEYAKVETSIWMGKVIIVMLSVSDCALAVAVLVLFFGPFCSSQFKNHLLRQESPLVHVTVMRIYAITTIMQFIATVLFEMTLLGRVLMDFMNVSDAAWIAYSYIYRIVQMIDCFLLMLCIYFGFARKQTVCALFAIHECLYYMNQSDTDEFNEIVG